LFFATILKKEIYMEEHLDRKKDGTLRKKYRDRFAHMADWIEKSNRRRSGKKFFSYYHWFIDAGYHTVTEAIEHPCGTVGCIGGWATVFGVAEHDPDTQVSEACDTFTGEAAKEYLGIDEDEADILFNGAWHPGGLDAPVKEIIAELRHIAATGKLPEHVELFD
jgi:hypothetical protein